MGGGSILVDYEQLHENLRLYQGILQAARERDLESSDGGAMSKELALSVNIALRKAVGKGKKFTDACRYKIIAELLGMQADAVDTVYITGRSAASEFLEICYGPNVDLHTNPTVRPEAAEVIQFLWAGAVEVEFA